ncbi:MAG TPA: hypothetical protein VGP72_28605 [Planctomycetota bacterium]|jgi:16S rRNA (cytosine967-C5)-methyltransferase
MTQRELDTIILDLWRRVRGERAPASRAVAAVLGSLPELANGERERIVGTLYGMLTHARRIEHALVNAEARPTDGARLLAYRVLLEKLPSAKAAARNPGVDWERVLAADAALPDGSDAVERIGVRASLPDFLARRVVDQYGTEAEALALSLTKRAPLTVRVNTLKVTRQQVFGELSKEGLSVRPGRLASTAIEFVEHVNVFALPQYAEGLIEVQDEASQLVAEVVAPPPHGLVIDYCAGAGGKTLALGALMRNQGRLIAMDTHARRLAELRQRARRAGLGNVQVIILGPGAAGSAERPTGRRGDGETGGNSRRGDAATRRHGETARMRDAGRGRPEERHEPENERFLGKADRVLVDVPCSGVGAFRRRPEMRWRLSEEDLERLPREQEAIARSAMLLCAPGGRLIYATCTLLAEENERVVERLLDGSDFQLVPIKEILGKERATPITDPTGSFLKLLPHKHTCDGFFAAVLRRRKS